MNPLEQVAAAVTPAVMVSACGLVALGLDNQIARMSVRVRELVREHRAGEASSPRRAAIARQVVVLDRRHALYYRALILDYAALFAFVATSALWLARAYLAVPAELPVGAFALGVVLLAVMAVLVIAAIHLARTTIQEEAAEVLADRPGGPPPHPAAGGPAHAASRP